MDLDAKGTRKRCPNRDSNPDLADFKSAASANWATGAPGQWYLPGACWLETPTTAGPEKGTAAVGRGEAGGTDALLGVGRHRLLGSGGGG